MKDIRSYLHLYVGCECEASQEGVKFTYNIKITPELLCDYDWIKPILRPLSDMTEDEAVEFIHLKHRSILCNIDRTEVTKIIFGESKNIIHFTYFKKRGCGAEGGGQTYYVNQSDPEQFMFLLSKGFDLFDLIPAGLAIDRTKHKATV
jgi:hypothetical protein